MAVIDASALAGWLLPDEDGSDLSRILGETEPIAPWLLWVELRNILVVIERKGRLDRSDTDDLLEAVGELGISFDTVADSAHVITLARRYGLTAYDSTYLELALRQKRPLATLDKALIKAAAKEGVQVL